MKLKQQNLIYNFKSTIKCLEAKLNIMSKLDENFTVLQNLKSADSLCKIKEDTKKVWKFLF